MTVVTIKQGDYLAKIAKDHGFADNSAIWDHPENAELKSKRNQNILFPGDKVFIPERENKIEQGATEKRHCFRMKKSRLMLRIRFRDFCDRPVKNAQCTLEIDGASRQYQTDGEGLLEAQIPVDAKRGKLTFDDPKVPFGEIPLNIGHLDPIEEESGWLARLGNLGYDIGPWDEVDHPMGRAAVEKFQCDHGLTVDGIFGPRSRAKLEEVYGC